jgi:hypothetical protein
MLFAAGCATDHIGDAPTPILTSVEPSQICNSAGSVPITLHGSDFAPEVLDSLGDDPTLVLPTLFVALDGQLLFEPLATALGDTTGMTLTATVPRADCVDMLTCSKGPFDLTIANGQSSYFSATGTATLAGALSIACTP